MKAKKIEITEEEIKTVQNAALRVWDYCASDILQLEQEISGRDYVSRAVAMEIALDAGRMVELADVPADLYAKVCEMPESQIKKIFYPVFTEKRYS